MPKFKYEFIHNLKEYSGIIEHPENLETFSNNDLAKRLIANKYSLNPEQLRFNTSNIKRLKEEKQEKTYSKASGEKTEWDKSLLGGTANLIGKGVKAGVNKAAEYNSEEAKQQREIKRLQDEEKRKIAAIEEERQAGIRKVKADKYKEEGKPLTAFLVELNPIYLMVAGLVYAGLFFIKMRGMQIILFKGGLSLVGVGFLAFIIKDYFKLKGATAILTIVGLVLIPIGITSWKAYEKANKHSVLDLNSSNQQNNVDTLQNKPTTSPEKIETKAGEKAEAKEAVENVATTPTIIYYKIQDPDGYSNLRKIPNGDIIKKVYDTETFEVIATEGKFKKVKLSNGTEGYISASRVVEAK